MHIGLITICLNKCSTGLGAYARERTKNVVTSWESEIFILKKLENDPDCTYHNLK